MSLAALHLDRGTLHASGMDGEGSGAPLAVFALSLAHDGPFLPWLAGLDAGEQARAARFIQPRHARRFVLRRWGLRCLLAARLSVLPETIGFVADGFGKPRLAPPHDSSGLRFSTSHSDELALIALRGGGALFGIDVERVRPMPDADDLVARFFSPAEQRDYAALAPDSRPEAFWRGWTVKEAFIKAIGQGLSFPLDSFDVALAPDRPAGIDAVRDGPAGPWTVRPVALGPEWRAAAVGIDLPPVGAVRHLTIESLPLPGGLPHVHRHVGSTMGAGV